MHSFDDNRRGFSVKSGRNSAKISKKLFLKLYFLFFWNPGKNGPIQFGQQDGSGRPPPQIYISARNRAHGSKTTWNGA